MKRFLLLTFLISFYSHISAQTYKVLYGDIVANVSSSNILNDLITFESLGVKEIGTTALNNTQAWIKARYQSLGYTDIVEQPFSYSGSTTNNIIITKTGTVYPNKFLIIDAHYDTINGTGSNDNGSGTVILLELARLLKDVNTEYSIKFIHFSGEEDGLIGSNYYVTNTVSPLNLDILLVLNIDEVGGINGQVNDTIVCEEDRSNPPANNVASTDATLSLATCVELYSNLNTEISFAYASDYMPFEDHGEIITGLYEKNESPFTHTVNDNLANMDANYVFEVAKAALGASLEFSVAYDDTLSLESTGLESNITLFPNPSAGKLHIVFKSPINDETSFKLFDVLGKIVYQTTLNQQRSLLDLSGLHNGVYLASFETATNKTVKKIVLN